MMFNLALLRLARRHVSQRVLQSALVVFGIAVGVAVGVAIDLANSSASRAFDLSVGGVTGRTTHQIVSSSGRLSTEIYHTIRVALGLRQSAPVIEATARARSLDNRTVRILGVDPFAEAPFRDYLQAASGQAPDPDALYAFIARPRSALITAEMAEAYALQPGDTVLLQTRSQPQTEVTVVGLLYPGDDLSAQALEDLLLVDIATAQEIAGQPGVITRIDLILSGPEQVEAIQQVLPEGVVVTTPSQSRDTLDQMTAAFRLNLRALSLVALLVGVFLIYNTITFNVVQRRPSLGVLRALGTSRAQIFGLVLFEALLLGIVGTALGLALGVILGQGTVRLVSQTINDLYFRVNVEAMAYDPATLVRGAVIGIAASVAAAIVPALEATQTPPAGVMLRSNVEQRSRRLLRLIGVGAAGMFLVGVALLWGRSASLTVSFAALFLILVAYALLTPLAMSGLMVILAPVTSRMFGVLGRMAPRAVVRSLSRTSVAVAALTLAVSVIVGVSVMIASFRSTLVDWLAVTLGADIFISPYAEGSADIAVDIDPALAERLAALDGVERVASVRSSSALDAENPDLPPVEIAAVDADITRAARRFVWLDAPGDDFWSALQAGDVVVSEPFAFRRSISQSNNRIALLTDEGPQTFRVAGVYYDYTSDQGTVLMHADVYRQYFDDPYWSALALDLKPDVDIEAALEVLQTEALVGTGLNAQSNRALRQNVMEIFDRTFAITVALRLLATIVAFIGILSALMALQLEQTRQYGIMRANGMTPRQLWKLTFVQTGLMGTAAGLLALPIGMVLALVLIYVINVRSFGWSMTMVIPPQALLQAFAVAVLAALAAGIYPAWKLGRLQTAYALRSE